MPQFTGHCCIKCIYLSPFWSSSSVEPLPGVLQLLKNSSPWHFFWLTKGASAFCHFRKVACAFLGGFWKAAQRLLLKAAEFLIFLKSCNLPPGLWSWVWHGSLLKSNNWSAGSTSMEFLKNWCWTLCFWMHKFQLSDHVWHMYLHLQWATPAILLCFFLFFCLCVGMDFVLQSDHVSQPLFEPQSELWSSWLWLTWEKTDSIYWRKSILLK